MKAFPFLIFVCLFFLLISLSSYRPISHAHAHSVSVSATVDEHLTFQKSGQQLSVSTNTPYRYTLISANGAPLGHLSGPQETKIDIGDSNFILVAMF